ncbi:ABC transporter ATP-binding protein/permease, partial [Candidatus Uhrbacteria bacterium]|nr:ABC transporter ATP-binding protein/permease [Candidatus Uhrbacteria bacterium]
MTKEERLSLEKPGWKEVVKAVPFVVRLIRDASPGLFYGTVACAMLIGPLNFVSVFALKSLTDAVGSGGTQAAMTWGIVLISVYLALGFLGSLQEGLTDIQRFKLEMALDERALRHVSSLPYKTLEDPDFQALATAFQRKAYLILNLQTNGIRMFQQLVNVISLSAALVFIPWTVMAFVIASLVIMFVLLVRYSEWSWTVMKRETREGRRAVYIRNLLETPKSQLSVKAMGLSIPMLKRWRQLIESIVGARISRAKRNTSVFWLSALCQVAGFASGLIILVPGVFAKTVALSSFVIFVTTYDRLVGIMDNFSWNASYITQESAFLTILKRFFETEEENDEGRQVPVEPLTVRFEDVWFRYPGTTKDVLRGFDLIFTEGEHVALVGLNGAGKSTILKLLMGTYEPTKGRITVNGKDLARIKPSAWRCALAVLMQDDATYDDLVSEQVRYGNFTSKLDPKRFRRALAASGLKDVAKEFPHGLETHAGKHYAMPEDEAIELSGGQRQIVAIARTLYRPARIYIFDEPTSHVDAEKEERFFEVLPRALQSSTALFVSHRFSTLRRAERIVVVDDGRVIEDGRHDDLLAKAGRYAELFALQAKMYQ